ncbi:MAG: outer membrane protein assembly factor BamA [Desulfobacterales bacterium]
MMQRKIFLFLRMAGVWLWAAAAAWPAQAQEHKVSEPIISRIFIEISETPGDGEYLEKMARDLIDLKEGELFSEEKFRRSVDRLTASKMFREIDIPDPDWTKAEIALTFRLVPFRRIRDIKISGGFPLLEKEILNAMSIYPGDVFDEKKLAEQEPSISKIFMAEGYIAPKIRVSAKEEPENGSYTVSVDIEKGAYFRIEDLRIKGNQAFSDARLKMRIKSWQSSLFPGGIRRLVNKNLDNDVKNLTEFYRKKGYADVLIHADAEKDPEKKTAHIQIHIDEGPRYDIAFEGNREFWDMTLKKDLVLAERGNKGDLGLRRSLRNIRDRYRKAGYAQVQVKTEEERKEKKGKAVRRIRIVIEEGPRSLTQAIAISGNEAVESEKIADQMLTRTPGMIADGEFVPDVLEEDKKAVAGLYLKQGYLETEIKEKIRWKQDEEKNRNYADIHLEITEGIQTRVSDVSVTGLDETEEAGVRKVLGLKPGEPFREDLLRKDESSIAELISEKGYPHVQVKGTSAISEDRSLAAVSYEIDKGPYATAGQVWISGNFRTKRKVFLNELEIKEGEPFSLKKMMESNRNIRNISALNSAQFSFPGLKEKEDQVDMLVSAEEKKPYYFQIGGGYDTAREFFVHSKVGDRNLFGMNREAWVGAEYSMIGYRGEMGITEPRFLGTRVSSTLSVFGEETEELNKDYGLRSYGASLGFNRSFWEKFRAGLVFRYEYREQYRVNDKTIPAGEEDLYEPRSILVTTPSLIYNSTDSYVRPTKGLHASASVDISSGVDSDQDDFFKYRAEARYFYTPVNRLTFAVRGRYGYIEPYGSQSRISDDQLFYLGGTADIRGFDENMLRWDAADDPAGGRTEILGSLEARFDLGMNFELATFYDIGSIKHTEKPDHADDFRSSAGLGLRYITPIGPIGFMYGWKLDREEGEDSGKLHFSVGYTF